MSTKEETMNVTPFVIRTLMWCHCEAQRASPDAGTPAFDDAIGWLGINGCIVRDHSVVDHVQFITTPKGKAWVALLCATPMPRMAFLDAQGKEIAS